VTRNDALQFIPLIEAWARGKVIQGRISGTDDWFDYTVDNLALSGKVGNYRIKPKKVKRYGRLVAGPNFLGSVWTDSLDVTPALNPNERWVGPWVEYEAEV
jgi:hypothetical protein